MEEALLIDGPAEHDRRPDVLGPARVRGEEAVVASDDPGDDRQRLHELAEQRVGSGGIAICDLHAADAPVVALRSGTSRDFDHARNPHPPSGPARSPCSRADRCVHGRNARVRGHCRSIAIRPARAPRSVRRPAESAFWWLRPGLVAGGLAGLFGLLGLLGLVGLARACRACRAVASAPGTDLPGGRPSRSAPRSTPSASRGGPSTPVPRRARRSQSATSSSQARGPSSALTGSTTHVPHARVYRSPASSTSRLPPGCVPFRNSSVRGVTGPRPGLAAGPRVDPCLDDALRLAESRDGVVVRQLAHERLPQRCGRGERGGGLSGSAASSDRCCPSTRRRPRPGRPCPSAARGSRRSRGRERRSRCRS